MIILGSIVTILLVVIGLGALLIMSKKIFSFYINITAPHFITALNNIFDCFEG